MPGYATFSPNYLSARQMPTSRICCRTTSVNVLRSKTPADARKQLLQCDNPGFARGIITLSPDGRPRGHRISRLHSSDNGAEFFNWPDGGSTLFRGEKNTQWEGGFRVPTLIRWPRVIKPSDVINDMGAHEDMMPTLLAAAGDTTVKEDLLKGQKIGDLTYKVHLDGYNLLPFLSGDVTQTPV